MNIPKARQEHVGLILLNATGEIEFVEPILLQEVSPELKDWVGLGFQQWLNYAFTCITPVDPTDTGDEKIPIWKAGSNGSGPRFLFKQLSSNSSNAIQVFKLRDSLLLKTQETKVSKSPHTPNSLENHWNQLMVWMGPGFLHDANNQMAALVSLAECLILSPDVKSLPEEDLADLKCILQCGKESAAIFQLLSKVYKLERVNHNYTDLRDLLNESAKLIEIALPNSVQINVKNDPTELPVRTSPIDFFQILLGLMAQALPNRNASPAGALHLKSSSYIKPELKLECIAGKWIKTDTITIEIQFDSELSASFPKPNELSHVSLTNFSNLLEMNKSFISPSSENCGWLIGFPKASVD